MNTYGRNMGKHHELIQDHTTDRSINCFAIPSTCLLLWLGIVNVVHEKNARSLISAIFSGSRHRRGSAISQRAETAYSVPRYYYSCSIGPGLKSEMRGTVRNSLVERCGLFWAVLQFYTNFTRDSAGITIANAGRYQLI